MIERKHIEALHEHLMRTAISLLNAGEEVQPMAFLSRISNTNKVEVIPLPPELVRQAHESIVAKRNFQQSLHAFVRAHENSMAGQVNEVWVAPPVKEGLDDVGNLSEHPNRQEAVSVVIHTANHSYGSFAYIVTVGGKRHAEFEPIDWAHQLSGRMTVQGDSPTTKH